MGNADVHIWRRSTGWRMPQTRPGQRLTLFKVGPHGPQLTLCTDVTDHDEQRVLPQVPVCCRQCGSGFAQRLRGVLSQQSAGASEPQPGTCLHGNAARPPGPSLGLHGNSVGVLGRQRPLQGECARFLKAGGRNRSLAAACQGVEPWRRRGWAGAATFRPCGRPLARSSGCCCRPCLVFYRELPPGPGQGWGSEGPGGGASRLPRRGKKLLVRMFPG